MQLNDFNGLAVGAICLITHIMSNHIQINGLRLLYGCCWISTSLDVVLDQLLTRPGDLDRSTILARQLDRLGCSALNSIEYLTDRIKLSVNA